MTYHLCAEDLTKTAIVPNLPEESEMICFTVAFCHESHQQRIGTVSCVR